MKSIKVLFALTLSALIYGCGGGGGGDNGSPAPGPGDGGGSGENATISGKITYDNVPHNPSTNGLNYNATTQDPARGVTVQLLQGSTVVDTTTTDDTGDYSLAGQTGTNYTLRVRAELKQTGTQAWDIEVVDNTSGNALYVLDSTSFQADSTTFTRNLNAASGWGGNSYTSTRAAAPFHILDRVYDVIDKLKAVDANLQLDPLVINWSPNNIPESGSINTGQIGTSYYSADKIYLLGAENTDTDEYDGHVIIHEWGHYFEDNNSRSDSIGGSHGGGDRLDMRVAFGEGFGNAWSAIITDDPFYRDSFNTRQSQGFSIDMESNNTANSGWFSEGSVQSILYDIYDAGNDDTVALGLGPIYDVLVGKQRNTEAFTSIFTFMTYIKEDNPSEVAGLNLLLSNQNIQEDIDIWGSTETDNEGQPSVLPVYNEFNPGDSRQLCTIRTFNSSSTSTNKLGNRKFLKLNIATSGTHTLRLTPSSGEDLDGYIYQQGNIVAYDDTGGSSTVNITHNFTAGTYVADVSAFRADACFNVALIQN